jgi:hypothetical protein
MPDAKESGMDSKVTSDSKTAEQRDTKAVAPAKKALWETPKLEDVSEQVMAQPYIRFT